MLSTIIAGILIVHCVFLGALYMLEERFFKKMNLQDNRWVERGISILQGLTLASCLVSLAFAISTYAAVNAYI